VEVGVAADRVDDGGVGLMEAGGGAGLTDAGGGRWDGGADGAEAAPRSATARASTATRATSPASSAASSARLTQRMASPWWPLSQAVRASSRAWVTSLGSPAVGAGTRTVGPFIDDVPSQRARHFVHCGKLRITGSQSPGKCAFQARGAGPHFCSRRRGSALAAICHSQRRREPASTHRSLPVCCRGRLRRARPCVAIEAATDVTDPHRSSDCPPGAHASRLGLDVRRRHEGCVRSSLWGERQPAMRARRSGEGSTRRNPSAKDAERQPRIRRCTNGRPMRQFALFGGGIWQRRRVLPSRQRTHARRNRPRVAHPRFRHDRCRRRRPRPRPTRRSHLLFRRPLAKYRPRPWRRCLEPRKSRRPRPFRCLRERLRPRRSPRTLSPLTNSTRWMRSPLPNRSKWMRLPPNRRSQYRPPRPPPFPRVRPCRFRLRCCPSRRSPSRSLRSSTPRSRALWRAPLSGLGSLFGRCARSPFSSARAPLRPCPLPSPSP
jgi:hypothetical protein